jgi:predicted Fe-Mo cluster-binding NifX family protein
MKIVFTAKGETWDSLIDERFGRCEMFVIFDEENSSFKGVSNAEVKDMGHGAGLQIAKKVLDLNPDIIITGNGAGDKALQVLSKSNVKMYIGAGGMSLKEAYEAYKNNELKLQF